MILKSMLGPKKGAGSGSCRDGCTCDFWDLCSCSPNLTAYRTITYRRAGTTMARAPRFEMTTKTRNATMGKSHQHPFLEIESEYCKEVTDEAASSHCRLSTTANFVFNTNDGSSSPHSSQQQSATSQSLSIGRQRQAVLCRPTLSFRAFGSVE
jgi:hypothetical protein